MCETTRTVVVRSGEIEVPTCIAGHVVNLTHSHVGVVYASCGADDPEPTTWDRERFGPWVPRARILIDIDDADAAFDAGYWVDVPTHTRWHHMDRIALLTVLEVTVPRTALQGPDEVPISDWRLAEVQIRSTVIP